MASPELSARLRYLNDSAHLLATVAPETSRHLMLRHNSLLGDSNLETSEAQEGKACGACGTIIIIGWNGTLQTQRARNRNTRHGEASKTGRIMLYKCDSCGRTTRHHVAVAPQNTRTKSITSKPVPSLAPAFSDTPAKSATIQTSTSSSKKRAKSRKQGSLQAMLAKQKESQALPGSGFGLDLMDFMKNG